MPSPSFSLCLSHPSKAPSESLTSDAQVCPDQLQSLDTEGVAPLSHPLDATQRLRADEVTETNQRDTFQRCAPAVENGLYLVPRVVE